MKSKQFSLEATQSLGREITGATSLDELIAKLMEAGYPLKEGALAILRAGQQALSQGSAPIQLDGRDLELRFSVSQTDRLKNRWSAQLSVVDPGHQGDLPAQEYRPLATGLWPGELAADRFELIPAAQGAEKIIISSLALTRQGWESKGLAQGLGILSNAAIEELIRRKIYPNAKEFVSFITDTAIARDPDKQRLNWSTNLAYLLGYELDPTTYDQFKRSFKVKA